MIRQHRLVALFDILGFGSRLKTEKLSDIRRQIRRLIREIRSEAVTTTATNLGSEDDDNLESARFVFDSVLLVSHDTADPENVRKFIFACITLLERGFLHGFPFRGSLTLSDVFSDEETGLLLGDQFPELRDGESMQDWTGAFIHTRAVGLVLSALCGEGDSERMMNAPEASHVIHWIEIPLREFANELRPFEAWCLNWVQMLEHDAMSKSLEYLKKVPSKHENTKRYVEYICSLPRRLMPLEIKISPGAMVKTLQCKGKFRMQPIDANGNNLLIEGEIRYEIRQEGEVLEYGNISPSETKQVIRLSSSGQN